MAGRASQHRYLRPLSALTLLTLEYLILSSFFDAYRLVGADGGIGALRWVGLAGPAIIAFATALWILGGAELREALATTPPIGLGRILLWGTVHLASFAGFFVSTALLFMSDGPEPGPMPLWAVVCLWFAAGAATLLSLIPISFGIRRLIKLIRELAAPLAFASVLGLSAFGAGLVSVSLWDPLSGVTLDAVAFVLDLLVSPIYFEPAELAIGTPDFWVVVAPVCSGYEGIGLIVVFLSAYLVGFHKRFRFPNVLVVIPAAILLMWLLNVMRIVALILVGHFWSSEVAIGGFHSKAGWLVFCGVALGAVWWTQRVAWFAADSSGARPNITNPAAPFLLPLIAVVVTTLVSGLFVEDFDYLYPARVLVALLALAWYRDEYLSGLREHLRGRPLLSWDAVGIGVAVYLVWIALASFTGSSSSVGRPEALDTMHPPLAFAWVVARTMGSIVTVPIIEELAFRGFFLRRLIGADFRKVPYEQWHWPAALISSLVFAAVHQQWIGGFVAGLAYAYAQKRRGLLSDAIVAHAVSNALISAHVLFGGAWGHW